MLDIVPSYHYMQFKEKLMNQTWENGKKTNFRPDLGFFGPNLGPQFFFMQFQGKLKIQTQENCKKNSF